jgi:hypothetical protein
MAKYRVIVNFKDLQDNGFFYKAGDEYPRAGKRVSKKRLAELASDANRRKTPMIEEIAEPAEE